MVYVLSKREEKRVRGTEVREKVVVELKDKRAQRVTEMIVRIAMSRSCLHNNCAPILGSKQEFCDHG